MNSLISSNISVYRAISEEAYLKMRKLIDAGRTPKANGGEGWIIKYDPEQKSFKQAMISIVFTGMWLEALMHQKIVSEFDEHEKRGSKRETGVKSALGSCLLIMEKQI